MALSFAQLMQQSTATDEQLQLLAALQGVGFVQHNGINGAPPLGSGNIAASGPALQPASVVISISSSGQVGSGQFSYSLDGGTTFTGPLTIPMNGIYILPIVGVSLVFANGLYTPSGGSFQAGETYTFQTFAPIFPVTNWNSGGTALTLINLDAQALSSLSATEVAIAMGGLVGTSTGAWLDLLAQNVYNLTRNAAVTTEGIVTLTAAAGAGPFTFIPGQLFVSDTTYNFSFSNLTGGTLSAGGTLSLLFGAQQPGSKYNAVAAGTIINLQTSLPGVTVNNPLQVGTAEHIGSGGGVVIGSGSPSGNYQITVIIQETGVPGTGTMTYSTGGSFLGPITIPTGAFSVGGTGVNLNFSGAFEAGDEYVLSTNWITQVGADQESDASLQQRCIGQWGTLAAGPPDAVYVNWAKAASPEIQVVKVSADQTTPGQVDVLVAGAGDTPVSAGAIAAAQTYIDDRTPTTSSALVSNVTVLAVAVTGTVYVTAAQFVAAQAALSAALYGVQVQVGIGGTVYLSEVEGAIQAITGVRNIEGLELNGSPADLALGATQVSSITGTGITWVAV